MTEQSRFGRRLPLPSTVEIKHELRLMAAADAMRAALASAGDVSADERIDIVVDELVRSRDVSPMAARMLADHFLRADKPQANAVQ